jgi:hypothetical protein
MRYDEAALAQVPYETVRAASVLAKEAIAAPSQLSILCRLSMARKVFVQHVNWMFEDDPRPYLTGGTVTTAAAELRGSCYIAERNQIDFWYRIANVPPKATMATLAKPAIRELLREQFDKIVDTTTPDGPWPLLSPFSVLRSALLNGGSLPREHVSTSTVLPEFTQTSVGDFETALRNNVQYYTKAEKIVEYA